MTINNATSFANREVMDLTFFDFATKKPFLNFPYANVTTHELSGEAVYAYGGEGHPKRVSFNGEKGGTISFETQMQTPKLYAFITGAELTTGANFLKKEKVKCATAGKLTLSKTPIEGTIFVYKENDDCGKELSGTFSVSSESGTNEITFTAGSEGSDAILVNNSYYVYYQTAGSASSITIPIKSNTFPKSFMAYASTYMKGEDDVIYTYQLKAYKCMPQSNFSVSFSNSGDPASITITCDLMVDGSNNLVDYLLDEE